MLGFLLGITAARAQEEGIYADFATSMGSFTCRLDYVNAPMTVANFIGLAEGSRAWIDLPTGQIRTNLFYDGIIFHRVITNFMSQTGSPNGQGTDGLGYVFPDEFSPALRHDGPGVLSMANSGKNSNGSQFFITAANTAWLDGVHSVFGRVISGMEVVDAINHVPTSNNRPLTPITILHVSIRRVGTEAEGFVYTNPALAGVAPIKLGITPGGGNQRLDFARNQYCGYRLSMSSNLIVWTGTNLGVEVAPPSITGFPLSAQTAATPRQFYSLSRVQYPAHAFLPWSLQGCSLQIVFTNMAGTIDMSFGSATTGTYTFSQTSTGSITSCSWQQTEPYRSSMWPIYFSGLYPMTLTFNYTTNTGGGFNGLCYGTVTFPVSGLFTMDAP
ncbi:MAG: hypothetical protein A2X46_03400 [Lentisphaerae bacterium GWF2_57_35]|nr:MAG: hypothetical protein A2X46_03400 [Lentisphaerae bacterium GWF2_57_35]